jgi:hypothetical protein
MDILKPLAIGAVLAAGWAPPPAFAQATSQPKQTQVWGLQGLRAGYCVRFLVDPGAASRELKPGFRLVSGSQDRALHPALQRVIQSQPEFATWIPSALCFYFTDAVQVGSRRVAEKDPRHQQMIAAWSLATQEEKSGARRDLMLGVFSARGSLTRAAEAGGVRLHEAQASVLDSAGASNDSYTIKLERTSLAWRGRPTGDSTRVARPIEESWSMAGLRGGVWAVQLHMSPAWSRALVGSLAVEGKGDLAKVMKVSPIRFVGPLYWGGAGELRFSR